MHHNAIKRTPMARITFNLSNDEHQELKKKAATLGLTSAGYTRQIIKDSQQKKSRQEIHAVSSAIRKLIPVLAIAMGKTQNQNEQMIHKLTQLLLKEYDQGGL